MRELDNYCSSLVSTQGESLKKLEKGQKVEIKAMVHVQTYL